jgi:hypothetical protein
MAASIALGCGGKGLFRGVTSPWQQPASRGFVTRYIVVIANSSMQITEFIRDSESFSIGAAAGEGLHYRFVVANATGRIEYLEELVDDEWQVVAGPPPLYLATLAAVKMADERWKHDYDSAVNTDPSPG